MGRINSRRKGATGEREFAKALQTAGHEARRGQQFHGGPDSPDVVTSLPYHFEVKRVESLSLYPAMEQSVRDCAPDKTPVVAHRRNGKGWLVVMRLPDFLALVAGGTRKPRSVRVLRRLS